MKKWTVTRNGPLSTEPYFLRLTKDGEPNAGTTYAIGDGGPTAVDQRRVVDPSFLDLVRFGILGPTDRAVRTSLPVIDRELGVRTRNGLFWRRASFDGYGETRTGEEWMITDSGTFTTLGRAWPILTDERGEYAVTAGQRRGAVPPGDGGRLGAVGHARRAGLGRTSAHRQAVLPPRRGHPLGDPADLVPCRPRPAGLDDPARAYRSTNNGWCLAATSGDPDPLSDAGARAA